MDPRPKAKHYEIDKDDNELEDNNSPSSSSSSKRRAIASISSSTPATTAAAAAARKVEPAALNCQADKCSADLSDAKKYLRRHKVCQAHFKAPVVIVAGIRKRFCQQCSKFHELSEFDETKRSCRRRLAGHNERRRKTSSESKGEGSSGCRQADQGGGAMNISLRGNPAYKNFQIR